ncbi:MAG: hypothetical protein IPP58_11575 [Holophagaceae bacterium]|uniref:Uncharacterized protein n=1 Tax=Candidatus Geothrix skivensis TaxID=2954439 RepID=A0A9D7XH91_9BACT|nr:hypothetical protein [Candidatus Geothrix skivensis]
MAELRANPAGRRGSRMQIVARGPVLGARIHTRHKVLGRQVDRCLTPRQRLRNDPRGQRVALQGEMAARDQRPGSPAMVLARPSRGLRFAHGRPPLLLRAHGACVVE